MTPVQRALIIALEAIRPAPEAPWPADRFTALMEIVETYGQQKALISDAANACEAQFQRNLERALGDPACPFCTAEMRDGRCPGCGHDPSTRRS